MVPLFFSLHRIRLLLRFSVTGSSKMMAQFTLGLILVLLFLFVFAAGDSHGPDFRRLPCTLPHVPLRGGSLCRGGQGNDGGHRLQGGHVQAARDSPGGRPEAHYRRL